MNTLRKALEKNKTLKVLIMNNVVCDQDIAEEVFEQLGNVLAASTSLEEISLNVLGNMQPSK